MSTVTHESRLCSQFDPDYQNCDMPADFGGGQLLQPIRSSADFCIGADGLINGSYRLSPVGLRLICRRLPGRLFSYLKSVGALDPGLDQTLAIAVFRDVVSRSMHSLLGLRLVLRPRTNLVTGVVRRSIPFPSDAVGTMVSHYAEQYGLGPDPQMAVSQDNSFYIQFADESRIAKVDGLRLTPVLSFKTSGETGTRLEAAVGVIAGDTESIVAPAMTRTLLYVNAVGEPYEQVDVIRTVVNRLITRIHDSWRDQMHRTLYSVSSHLELISLADHPTEEDVQLRAGIRAKQAATALTPFLLGRIATTKVQLLLNFRNWVTHQPTVDRQILAAETALSFFSDTSNYHKKGS